MKPLHAEGRSSLQLCSIKKKARAKANVPFKPTMSGLFSTFSTFSTTKTRLSIHEAPRNYRRQSVGRFSCNQGEFTVPIYMLSVLVFVSVHLLYLIILSSVYVRIFGSTLHSRDRPLSLLLTRESRHYTGSFLGS